MTPTDLNRMYDAASAANPETSAHILVHQIAIDANLEVVRHDDQSGTLYRAPGGRLIYGWESGGFQYNDEIE